MSRISLHLLAPGLLDRVSRWARDFGSLPRFAGIEALLSKASKSVVPSDGVDATLCGLFGLVSTADRDLPLGALRRLGCGRSVDRAFWLCADPVNLKAGVARVFLRDGGSLNITQSEAGQLGEMFAAHFGGSGLTLETTAPACWHLRLPSAARITTYAQRQVMGRAIDACLPIGADAAHWRALLNETQMLFHDAEVNRTRERRGELAINGLWLSGAGPLPDRGDLNTFVDKLWSDDPLALGLGRLAGVETRSTPDTFDSIVSDAVRHAHLVSLEGLLTPASYDDFSVWCAALTSLDRAWFAPVARAIKKGDVAQCHIYDCAGGRYSINRARQWRVWRRARSLAIFADPASVK